MSLLWLPSRSLYCIQGFRKSVALIFPVPLLIFSLMVLAGCLRPEHSDVITIRFATAEPNLDQVKLTQSIIAHFEKLHPDIHVECEFGVKPQKIIVQIAAGVGPDVFMWWFDYQPLILRNALTDLAPLAAHEKFDWSVFYPCLLNYYRRGKAIYAMPIQMKTYCIVYNKEIFDRAREPYPNETWTWAHYLEIAKKLTIRPPGEPAKQFGNGPFPEDVEFMMHALGGNWLNRNHGEFNPDTMQNRDALLYMIELFGKASPQKQDTESFGGGALSQAFLTGKIAMQVAPAWMLGIFSNSSINWDIAPLPLSIAGTGVMFDDAGLAINAKSSYKEEAFKLLAFYTQQTTMKAFAFHRNGLSSRMDSNKPFIDPRRPATIEYLKAADKATIPAKLFDLEGNAEYYQSIIRREFELLYPLEQISIDEFLLRLKRKLNTPKPNIG